MQENKGKEKNEFSKVESEVDKIVKEVDKIEKKATEALKELSELKSKYHNGDSSFNFSFTRNHLNHYLILKDKNSISIYKIFFSCMFVLLIIASIIITNEKLLSFDFDTFKMPFNCNNIVDKELIISGVIAITLVHLLAFYSHILARNDDRMKLNLILIQIAILILILIPIQTLTIILNQIPMPLLILNLMSLLFLIVLFTDKKVTLMCIFSFILSPDLFYAKYNKNSIKVNIKINRKDYGGNSFYKDEKGYTPNHWNAIKIELKSYIQNCNWLNVIISVILAIIGFIIIKLNYIPYFYIQLFLCIIIFRIISRGIEVIISFYKDIVTTETKLFHSESDNGKNYEYIYGFKSSILNQKARLSLAIHTLFEFVILFAIAYYVFFNFLALTDCSFISVNQSSCEKNEITPPSFYEMLLFSGSLGVFNISYGNYQNILLGFLHVSQILISAVLILISIAQYAGGNSKLSSEEEALYRNAAIAERENESIDEEIQSIIEDKEKLDERIKKLNDGEKEKLGEKIEDLDKQICSINDEKKKLDDSYLRKSLDLSNS